MELEIYYLSNNKYIDYLYEKGIVGGTLSEEETKEKETI